jgi:hypothetical protein
LSAGELAGEGRLQTLDRPRSQVEVADQLIGEVHELEVDPEVHVYWSPRSADRLFVRRGTAKGQAVSLTWHTLPFALEAPPVLFRGGILAAAPEGRIEWLNFPNLTPQAKPFQGPVELQQPGRWRALAVTADETILACDDRGAAHRLQLQNEPMANLAAQESGSLPKAPASPIAIVGNAAYFIDSDYTLWAIAIDTLKSLGQWELSDGVAWGPFAIGEFVLVVDRSGVLRCVDGQGQLAWQVSLEGGIVVGRPLVVGDQCYLAQQQGRVRAISLANGSDVSHADVEQTLATGPVKIGDQLVVGTADDTLLVLPLGLGQR